MPKFRTGLGQCVFLFRPGCTCTTSRWWRPACSPARWAQRRPGSEHQPSHRACGSSYHPPQVHAQSQPRTVSVVKWQCHEIYDPNFWLISLHLSPRMNKPKQLRWQWVSDVNDYTDTVQSTTTRIRRFCDYLLDQIKKSSKFRFFVSLNNLKNQVYHSKFILFCTTSM